MPIRTASALQIGTESDMIDSEVEDNRDVSLLRLGNTKLLAQRNGENLRDDLH